MLTHQTPVRRNPPGDGPTPPGRVRAVFLDVGGTLLKMGRPHEVYSDILRQFGHHVPPDHLREVNKRARQRSLDLPGGPGPDHTIDGRLEYARREAMVGYILEELNVDAHLEECRDAIMQSWISRELFPAYDDTGRVLRRLKELGYLVVAVSNWESRLAALCASHGFHQYFDHIVASEAEGHVKPGTRLFEIALERTGVRPDQTVHVGDRLQEDALAARASGLTGVLLVREGDPPEGYQPVIRRLDELVPLLQTL